MDALEGAGGDEAGAVAGLGAPCDLVALRVADGSLLRRRVETEVVDRLDVDWTATQEDVSASAGVEEKRRGTTTHGSGTWPRANRRTFRSRCSCRVESLKVSGRTWSSREKAVPRRTGIVASRCPNAVRTNKHT